MTEKEPTRVSERETHVVPCSSGGDVVLDAPLYRLWSRARDEPEPEAIGRWCAEESVDLETGRWALETLSRAGVLPGSGGGGLVPNPSPPRRAASAPLVSVIILEHDGRRHLEKLLPSIARQAYPNVEIIVVDNGSGDGSTSWLEEHWPEVEVVRLPGDAGFSGANHHGIERASGDLFLLLNNDTALDENAIAHLVARLEGEEGVAAVVPQVRLMSQPGFVNTLGNDLPRRGWARDSYIGHLDLGQLVTVGRVPSASFGAVLIPRKAFETVGPMDEAYGYYYEDMDWSWRARLAGLQILAEPRALVFHSGGGTSARRPRSHKLSLVARNRLRFAAKNLSPGRAIRFLLVYLGEDLGEILRALKGREIDVLRAFGKAWLQFLLMVPAILRARQSLHRRRLVSDDVLLAEMKEIPLPRNSFAGPVLTLPQIVEDYGPQLAASGQILATSGPERKRILVVSHEGARASVESPDRRSWELAHVLAEHADVTLAVPVASDRLSSRVELLRYKPGEEGSVVALAKKCAAILSSLDAARRFRALALGETPLVLDLHAPSLLGDLESDGGKPLADRDVAHRRELDSLKTLLKRGDFFICASERQRDFWLGMLFAAGRLSPLAHAEDETVRRLLDVVPFGIPARPPDPAEPALKGVVPGVAPEDKVILWTEGMGRDHDAATAIEAMVGVVVLEPRARLYFTEWRESDAARDALRSCRERGLLDGHVFFRTAAPPMASSTRTGLLAEADVALGLHHEGVATGLGIRTELLDAIAAGLPLVVSEGDSVADVVRRHGLGRVVAPADVQGTTAALLELLSQGDARRALSENFERARAESSWMRAAEPLVRFCRSPRPAFDREARSRLAFVFAEAGARAATPIHRLPARALELLREDGAMSLVRRGARHLKWRLTRLRP